MHIPDGFLDPKMAGGLGLAAAGVLSLAISKVRAAITQPAAQRVFAGINQTLADASSAGKRVLGKYGQEYISKIGMVASLVFAAQMFNFPISSGTSGHLMGGVLSAALLGPFGGTIAVSAVLAIQSLFFADGGLFALGANIVNMAILGCFVSYYLFVVLKKYLAKNLSIMVAAWFSVVLASLACSLEIGFSGTYQTMAVIQSMLPTHAIIGVAEALITIALFQISKQILGWQGYNEV